MLQRTQPSVRLSLGLAESRILPAASVDISHLILHCPAMDSLCAARSLAILCHSMTSGPDPGELPSFWGSMDFHHAPTLRRARVINNNNSEGIVLFCIMLKRFGNLFWSRVKKVQAYWCLMSVWRFGKLLITITQQIHR